MANTVDELRNEIREGVGRFEREASTAFTKESLAAISEVFGYDVGAGQLPGKGEMRAAIARRVEGIDDERDHGRPFRKSELEAIVTALTEQ